MNRKKYVFLQVRMVLKSITRKKANETINRELVNSLQENDHVEEQELNETANNVNISQETMHLINR